MDLYAKQQLKSVKLAELLEQFTMCTNKNTLDTEDNGHTLSQMNRGRKRDQDDGKVTLVSLLYVLVYTSDLIHFNKKKITHEGQV